MSIVKLGEKGKLGNYELFDIIYCRIVLLGQFSVS